MLDADNTGSTACVCLLRLESGHKVLYIANLGDTRCVISRNGMAERMSIDHKANDELEQQRVRADGGIIMDNRVGGSLAITRAFGDHSLKNDGVTAVPSVRKHFIRPFDKYLVIATDGVWDVLEDQDAVDQCKDELNTN